MKLTNKPTGHHYISKIGTVLNTKPNSGKNDSLSRTARAMLYYDENRLELYAGIHTYFNGKEVYRYWDTTELTSRDHTIVANACCKLAFGKPHFNKVPITSPSYTIGQRIWLKAVSSKLWSFAYLLYKLPGLAIIYPLWNWTLRAISGTLKTYKNPAECRFIQMNHAPTKWQELCFKCTLKTFAMFYTLYQILTIESKWVKQVLQKVMILHFEKSNYVARVMCGQNVDYPEGYFPSRNNRWNVRLDRTCKRDMRTYNDTEKDNLEVGMLKYYCKQT